MSISTLLQLLWQHLRGKVSYQPIVVITPLEIVTEDDGDPPLRSFPGSTGKLPERGP